MTKCLRCKYHQTHDCATLGGVLRHRCTRSGAFTTDPPVHALDACFWERSFQGACGPGAKFFQPMEGSK